MGLDGYKIRHQQAVHFITFATMQWIDVFTRVVSIRSNPALPLEAVTTSLFSSLPDLSV